MHWYCIDDLTDVLLHKTFRIFKAESFQEAANNYHFFMDRFPLIIIKDTTRNFYMVPVEMERWSLDDIVALSQYRVKESPSDNL